MDMRPLSLFLGALVMVCALWFSAFQLNGAGDQRTIVLAEVQNLSAEGWIDFGRCKGSIYSRNGHWFSCYAYPATWTESARINIAYHGSSDRLMHDKPLMTAKWTSAFGEVVFDD